MYYSYFTYISSQNETIVLEVEPFFTTFAFFITFALLFCFVLFLNLKMSQIIKVHFIIFSGPWRKQ